MADTPKPGTYYACQCWHEGNSDTHPPNCPTHGKPWKIRYRLQLVEFLYMYENGSDHHKYRTEYEP